jgi:hypothetical protein
MNWVSKNESKKSMKHIRHILMLMLPLAGFGQHELPEAMREDPKAQERIQSLRIAYITERLGLTTEQAEKFWPIYREYSQERRRLNEEMREARRQLDRPNPEKEQQLVELGLQLRERELKLDREYAGRLREVISAQQILNLQRAEGDFRNLIMQQIQQRREMQQRREQFRENQRLRPRNN